MPSSMYRVINDQSNLMSWYWWELKSAISVTLDFCLCNNYIYILYVCLHVIEWVHVQVFRRSHNNKQSYITYKCRIKLSLAACFSLNRQICCWMSLSFLCISLMTKWWKSFMNCLSRLTFISSIFFTKYAYSSPNLWKGINLIIMMLTKV